MPRLYIHQTPHPKAALGVAQGKVSKGRQKVALYFSTPPATKTLITQSAASATTALLKYPRNLLRGYPQMRDNIILLTTIHYSLTTNLPRRYI